MEQKVKIYFTSDLHGYFFDTNYADRTNRNLGALRCASQYEKDGNTLIIDGGDILQGSAFAYYCQKELNSNQPIADMMNLCGYDFVTLGNHDFNYGMEYLNEYVTKLNASCICQNVIDKDGKHMFPYQIKVLENGVRVGVVGIVTDYVNVWEKPENIKGISIVNPFEEAKKALEELKGNVDLTIGVYHGGFERNLETKELLSESTENVAYKICEELDFDILLTGHQHMSIEGQYVHGTYVVQPKENGTEYHCIEVLMDGTENKISSQLKKADSTFEAEKVAPFMEIEEKVQDWLDNVVGKLETPLLPESKIKMAKEGNKIASFINQIQLHYSGAKASAVSLANEIKGFNSMVTRRDIIATYPYPNTLVVFEITGAKLRQAMERSAEYFAFDEEGNLCVSKAFLEPKVEHYNYDFYAGIEYTIDPEKEIGQRITSMKYQGNDIKEDEVLTVCVNNYRASGAGNYPVYQECPVVKEINTEMVELIMDYFEQSNGEVITVK